jgi:hypothetical protein
MGLVYDSRVLPGVTIIRPRVAGVLQMVSELTLTVSWARLGQLRRYGSVRVRDVGTYT